MIGRLARRRALSVTLAVVVTAVAAGLGAPSGMAATAPGSSAWGRSGQRPLLAAHTSVDAELQAAARKGPVPVIAQLDDPSIAGALAAGSGPQAAHAAVATASAHLAAALPAGSAAHVQALGSHPLVAMTVDARGLAALAAQPDVVHVSRNHYNKIDTTYTSNLTRVGAPTAWAAHETGVGQTVAILDTGVDGTNAFLSTKVVAEACFSGDGGAAISLCPGGVPSTTAGGSGMPCALLSAGCFHGTHVAGIVAGGNGGGFSGVAPGAKLISIDVFSTDGSGDIGAFDSDIIDALDYVYSLRNTYDIASVNMSLGSLDLGELTSNGHCDGDQVKPAIDQLRAAGIATVVASGNDSQNGVGFEAIETPACISSAVAVGSVNPANDVMSHFSDSSPAVSLLAPGEGILSSVPPGTPTVPVDGLYPSACPAPYSASLCGDLDGTSMATPHVAGAFAVLRQARPGLAVGQEVDQLQGTGATVSDPAGFQLRSLDEGKAVTQVRPTSFPGGVTQNKDGRFEAFMANSNGVYDKWQKAVNGGWSGWVGRGGPVRNPVIAATDFDGRLEVFGTSSGGVLYHAWQKAPGGSWSGWASLGGSVSGNHFTVLMNADGHLEVLAVTTGNVIEHLWQTSPGGSWTGWHFMGVTVPGVRGITSVRLPDGEGFTSIITGVGELIVDVQDRAGGAWDDWAILNGRPGAPSPVMVGNPVLGVDLDDRLEVMAADTSGRVWSYYETFAQALDIFTHRAMIISGGVTSGRLAVGRDGDGRLELFDARPGGSIIDMWQKKPGSSWGGPAVLASSAGSIPSPIQAMSTVDGRIELFSAQGSDHDWQVHANGPWSGWRPF